MLLRACLFFFSLKKCGQKVGNRLDLQFKMADWAYVHLFGSSLPVVMKIMIKYDKKYQKQLKRGRHYEWMKQLSTFCGLDKGWKVLMGRIEWEGQALWCLQGAFSGGEREACHSPEAAGIESAGVSWDRKLSSGGESQQRTDFYPGKTQLPFARESRALSVGV